jgi:hypothetical protein
MAHCVAASSRYHLASMRISQAGLKSGHPTTRFATSAGNSRERHLGLRRGVTGQMTAYAGSHARVPLLAALRRAARTTHSAEPAPRPEAARLNVRPQLRPSISITWSSPTGSGSRRPRPRSAAPWRG